MIDLTIVLIGIVVLFAIFLALRTLFSFRVCALCAAVATAWIVLLALFYSGSRVDPMLVGILMGGSIVGVMYLLEQKLPETYHLFKLSFFLTLVSLAYFVLVQHVVYGAVWVLVVLWLLFGLVYVGRNKSSLNILGKKLIECCKNW